MSETVPVSWNPAALAVTCSIRPACLCVTKEDKMCDAEQNPAAIPTPLPDNQGDGRWMSLHNHFMMSSKDKEPEVVFIGDSNIQMMHQLEIWRELFSPLHALNFGGIGEGTHHVLWRIVNGELKHIKPKIIVLWVGTYNQGHSAEQIAGGIQAIVDTLEKSQPQAKVIVLSLLPRGKNPNPLRQRNARVNEMLTNSLPATPNAVLLNIDPGFVHSDGTISHHDLYDYLHLTRQGYARVCLTLQRTLLQLMESRVKTEEP
uniref:Platelet-activating factor acetylhydrolase IB subunit alpha1 n=1 Tax=Leptobrachium leishanense TaxID=445787 RepID=A0A8C5PK01_9ANUR